jgi:predicted transcriptional regulator of viral defense system
LLNKSRLPYLTTSYLLDMFSEQKYPRDKIKNLLAKGELIHLKQGLYLLADEYGRDYSKEVIAGMLYGPSAISYEYALSYHGIIPERVEVITCVCFKRNKKFSTPIGEFNYRYQAQELYPLGIHLMQTSLGNFFLATPEKALCDIAYDLKMTSTEEALDYLLGSLRCDEEELRKLNASLLMRLVKIYKRRSVQHLVEALIIFQQKDN